MAGNRIDEKLKDEYDQKNERREQIKEKLTKFKIHV